MSENGSRDPAPAYPSGPAAAEGVGSGPGLSRKFDDALKFASDCHRRQVRKGTRIPYMGHVLGVCALVLEVGGNETEAIAALLHDTIEDAADGETASRIRRTIARKFGPDVLAIVESCTDAGPEEKAAESALPTPEERVAAWYARKRRYLTHLDRASAAVRRVSCADKLHNARTIRADLRIVGDPVWDRFTAGRAGTLWYYRAAADLFSRREVGALADSLRRVVGGIEELAGATHPHMPASG